MSSSGLVLPSERAVREAHVTGNGPAAPLLVSVTVPAPWASEPSQTASAVRWASAMTVPPWLSGRALPRRPGRSVCASLVTCPEGRGCQTPAARALLPPRRPPDTIAGGAGRRSGSVSVRPRGPVAGRRLTPRGSRPPDPEDVMKHEEFRLERYMSQYEFSARHLLAGSDCESYPMAEVVSWADDECRELWEALRLGYTESPGLPQLRREIAGLYDSVSPDDILEVVPEEGVLIAMTVLLEPGDHVIATHPGYQTLYGIAEALGCEVTYWEPDEERGWRFDPAFVRRELRPSTRLIVANFPHNPTGYLPTAAEYQELLDIAAEAGAYVSVSY